MGSALLGAAQIYDDKRFRNAIYEIFVVKSLVLIQERTVKPLKVRVVKYMFCRLSR